jgi:flagellar motor switch/type III secretory pathway protein FliN
MAEVAQAALAGPISPIGQPNAIVPQPIGPPQDDARWWQVRDLGCDLTVDLPIPNFQIADLLKLQKGSVIDAHWKVGRDVPFNLNGTQIGWVEFEVLASKLAARLTELA